ncbi:synaptotagmin-5-like isoform X2 [Papaver somniferum]|uniref:synaptotagmin-5-like isoform X2 n=1 Tax=Papaver somniferum TaxID=3469 RepID=UPI000E701B61|nr:synaptotagmin-5-like isoform X2 [Papaver somniferum]
MSFFFGLIIGISVGIGLIAAFVHYEKSRSKHRSHLAAIVASFARLTVNDAKKILPDDFYPSWVVFSHRQKLNWLNLHLTKIWPYVNEAASELIRNNVEPVLEQYRPVILSSLKFSRFTLGTVAPQLTGVSIIEDGTESITMDLELQWDGNPSIILDIKTKLGIALPVQQKLDFTLKVVGGDISSIPGVSDAIEETIRDAIEDSLTWPVRKVVPIIPGDYSELELQPVGTLGVKLIQAKELTNKDVIGKSDPFAVLYIRPLRNRMKTSKTIKNQLNPVWNEHYEFIVEDETTQNLVLKVFDDDGIRAAELIGCVCLKLKDLEPGKVKDIWLNLVKDLDVQRDKKNRGQVHLELLYCPFGTGKESVNPFASKYSMTSLERALSSRVDGMIDLDPGKTGIKRREVILRGVLSVTVISAVDLPIADLMGLADPYVVLQMKKCQTRSKTRVINNCLNPVWNQTFDFVVEDGLHDMLQMDIYDHDLFGKDYMGRCILTLTRVILEGQYKDSFHVEGTKCGKLNLHLKWTAQPVYRNA